jgi:hypothetical protein
MIGLIFKKKLILLENVLYVTNLLVLSALI